MEVILIKRCQRPQVPLSAFLKKGLKVSKIVQINSGNVRSSPFHVKSEKLLLVLSGLLVSL